MNKQSNTVQNNSGEGEVIGGDERGRGEIEIKSISDIKTRDDYHVFFKDKQRNVREIKGYVYNQS